MHHVTSKTRDRLIFSTIILVLVAIIITVIWYISTELLLFILTILAGLKLGDFIYMIAERLVNWLDETLNILEF